jgi:hypothetical protein
LPALKHEATLLFPVQPGLGFFISRRMAFTCWAMSRGAGQGPWAVSTVVAVTGQSPSPEAMKDMREQFCPVNKRLLAGDANGDGQAEFAVSPIDYPQTLAASSRIL